MDAVYFARSGVAFLFSMKINMAGYFVFIGIAPVIVYSVVNTVNVMDYKLYKRFGFFKPDKEQ